MIEYENYKHGLFHNWVRGMYDRIFRMKMGTVFHGSFNGITIIMIKEEE